MNDQVLFRRENVNWVLNNFALAGEALCMYFLIHCKFWLDEDTFIQNSNQIVIKKTYSLCLVFLLHGQRGLCFKHVLHKHGCTPQSKL